MSAESSFNRFVRTMDKFLTGHGFQRKGGRVFRKYSPAGDAVIIDLQTSSWSDKAERRFFVNAAFVLGPEWTARQRRLGRDTAELPKTVHGIWRNRVGRTGWGGGDPYAITDDDSADRLWEQLRPQLEWALTELEPLLNRTRLQEWAQTKEASLLSRKLIRAWLLAENGPSRELTELMDNELPASQDPLCPQRPPCSHRSDADSSC